MTATDALRLAQVPPFCPGTGHVVTHGEVDGNNIALCPSCKRWRIAYPITYNRFTIEAHRPPRLPRRTPGANLHLFGPEAA